MKTYLEFKAALDESFENLPQHKWDKNPKIGWWKDAHPDHLVMYHGTHDRNVDSIKKNGIHAPKSGSTKGWVSMTHDPHTAHAYASMSGSGGETGFRNAGQKAVHTPHEHRSVLVAHIPKKWAESNMNHEMRGNIPETRDRLTNKDKYEQHKAAGRPDHEYYQSTELRFKDHIPPEFIKHVIKKTG